MLQDEFSSEEQKVAAETIWNLAFVESIRQSDILQHTIPTLKNLMKSEDKEVRRACVSALFEIQGDVTIDPGTTPMNNPSTPPPSYHEAISEPAPTATNRNVQIMISYQWDSQERAKQIRDNLAAAGYKIWMDVTNMRGDILKAMADAVEKSDVILICMTEQYKDSQSCRSGPIRPTSQGAQGAIVSAPPPKQGQPAAAGWSKEDIQRWLRDNDLTELCEKFRRFGGRHLKMKYDEFCEDKAKFKNDMKSDYGMDDAVYTDFVVNLQDAFDE